MNDQGRRAFTPDPGEHSTPLRRLATAVLVMAVQDALKGDEYATLWLTEAGTGFELWAELLHLNPQTARRRVATYLRDNHGTARRVNRRAAR